MSGELREDLGEVIKKNDLGGESLMNGSHWYKHVCVLDRIDIRNDTELHTYINVY